jgi:hypothetical protein
MFVDTELLRMGADFSSSAGTIVHRGATELASTRYSVGIFGDFETAHQFHSAVSAAHQVHANTMAGHHTELESLAEKANSAAVIFHDRDETLAGDVAATGLSLPDH